MIEEASFFLFSYICLLKRKLGQHRRWEWQRKRIKKETAEKGIECEIRKNAKKTKNMFFNVEMGFFNVFFFRFLVIYVIN